MADIPTNRCSFTLAAAITSSAQTALTRADDTDGLPGDSNGPASGPYSFVMTDGDGNYEIGRVTDGQGTTSLTVARATEPIAGVQTALSSVPSGTACYAVETADGLAALQPVGLSGVAGVWYQIPPVSSASATGTVKDELACPFFVRKATTIRTLGIWVETAAVGGSNAGVRLGIRADAGDLPDPAAAPLLDLGLVALVSLSATGYAYVTLSDPLALAPGKYWMTGAYQYSSAPSTAPKWGVATQPIGVSALMLLLAPTAAGAAMSGYYQTGVAGALPDGFTIAGPCNTGGGLSVPIVYAGT